ncbi:MAG: hypothetical protein AAGF24_06115, partial [Cyanobacteria bacterium P01_H01_bin.121]
MQFLEKLAEPFLSGISEILDESMINAIAAMPLDKAAINPGGILAMSFNTTGNPNRPYVARVSIALTRD